MAKYIIFANLTTENSNYVEAGSTVGYLTTHDSEEDMTVLYERLPVMDTSYWEYHAGSGINATTGQTYNEPSLYGNNVNMGTLYIVNYYMPVLDNTELLDDYAVKAIITPQDDMQRVGLCTITEESNAVTLEGFFTTLGDLTIGSKYSLEWKFYNSKCYLYLNGYYTGHSYDFSDLDDDLYFVAYNPSNEHNLLITSLSTRLTSELNRAPTALAHTETLDIDFENAWNFISGGASSQAGGSTGTSFQSGRYMYEVYQRKKIPYNVGTLHIEFNIVDIYQYFQFGLWYNDGLNNLRTVTSDELHITSTSTHIFECRFKDGYGHIYVDNVYLFSWVMSSVNVDLFFDLYSAVLHNVVISRALFNSATPTVPDNFITYQIADMSKWTALLNPQVQSGTLPSVSGSALLSGQYYYDIYNDFVVPQGVGTLRTVINVEDYTRFGQIGICTTSNDSVSNYKKINFNEFISSNGEHTVELRFDGTSIHFYVDGTYCVTYSDISGDRYFYCYTVLLNGLSVLSLSYSSLVSELPSGGGASLKQVIRQEDEVSGFDLTTRSYNNNDNMSTATAVAPYITSEGLLDCGVDCNMHHPLPSGTRWEIHINCEITGDAGIFYNNNVDGGVSFRNGTGGFKIYNSDISYNQASRLGDFTDTNNTTNTLSIIREENNITFRYTDVNGNLVSYTRTYTSLSINGTFYLRIANGSLIVHSLTMIEEGGGGGN